MSLKINNWRRSLKWIALGIVGFLFIFFLVRVVTFENNYYAEKEGSERAVVEATSSNEVIEVEPTAEEVAEYTVAADRPRYLSIGKLGIVNSRILPMGVNTEGELDTPRNIFDVGWYESSGKPGQGGTMLIDGHNGGPHVYGVFKRLPELTAGDIIKVERGDGEIFQYSVVENVAVSLEKSDAYMSTALRSPEPGKESLTLITCTGEWSEEQGTYLSRQFTRAVIVK